MFGNSPMVGYVPFSLHHIGFFGSIPATGLTPCTLGPLVILTAAFDVSCNGGLHGAIVGVHIAPPRCAAVTAVVGGFSDVEVGGTFEKEWIRCGCDYVDGFPVRHVMGGACCAVPFCHV